ncbi:hypothetical protein Halar_3021 [halophilic archaeon DL31]|jgi:hypothetical protein|nr:hypothetical protein Halar_3021 [halophilic archaeon DL31]
MRFLALLVILLLTGAAIAPISAGGSPPAVTTPVETDVATPTPSAPIAGDGDTDQTGAANMTAANGSNVTQILAVPGPAVQRTELDDATLTLGPSTRFAGNITAVRIETIAVERHILETDDQDERSRRIIAAFSTIEQEVITLRGRQRAAIEAFNRGDLSPEAFVIELATIAARADAMEDRVSMLSARADEIEGFSLARSNPVTYELRAFGGPVRERAIAAMSGDAGPTRFFVTTGSEGYELTTIDNETYVREAYRGAVRSGDADASIDANDAINVTKDSYPGVVANSDTSATVSGTTAIVTQSYGSASLTAFVDAESERVFKEYQRIPLTAFTTGPNESNVLNGIQITVNRTYPGGPMRIHVTDAENGEPVNLTVTLSQGPSAGTALGRTGDDGVLWTLSPRGQFTVTAVGEETSAAFLETNSTDAPEI